jgi:hypothetical protein
MIPQPTRYRDSLAAGEDAGTEYGGREGACSGAPVPEASSGISPSYRTGVYRGLQVFKGDLDTLPYIPMHGELEKGLGLSLGRHDGEEQAQTPQQGEEDGCFARI